MQELKLLVCSDLHGSIEALDMMERVAARDSYDAIVVCGDFTTYGSLDYVNDFLRRMKTKVMAVPGNCDTLDTVAVLEAKNASVHNARVRMGEWWFFGFGGGVPSSANMPFEVDEDIMERSLRSIAVEDGIMVTHMPAYGMNDKARSGHHMGSKAILRVAKEFAPTLAFSGHIHESPGKEMYERTMFVNPGPARNGHYATVVAGDRLTVQFKHETGASSKPKML